MAGIEDVARHAGVSASTVSYALSGKRSISPATKARIQDAVRALEYRPHAGARALASQRTNTLALVVPLRRGMDLNVVMYFVAGVLTQAREHDYDVLLLTERDDQGITRVANGKMVDGLIVMDVESRDPRLDHLAALEQPVILIGLPEDSKGISCVDFDFAAAGRQAVATLSAKTPGPIALIASPQLVYDRGTSFALRLREAALDEAQKVGRELIAVACEATPGSGREAVRILLDDRPELSGIIVHNEAAAPGALSEFAIHAATHQGIVPAISIEPDTGLGDTEYADGHSVIAIPAQEIGAKAVDMLIERLNGQVSEKVALVPPAAAD